MPELTPRLRVRLDRTQIDGHRDTTAFLVVEIAAPELEDNTPRPDQPLNFGLVIDASGSMAGATVDGHGDNNDSSRIEAAKRAASGIVERLEDADILSVVSFADDTLTHIATMPMSNGGRASAIDAIGSVHTRGCTDLNGGWLKGAEHVARYMEEQSGARNRVLLLSDGHANQGVVEPDLLASTAAGLRNRGIYTSTVGIGLDYSTAQLEVLAEFGGGMMHHAEHAEDIVAVILAELNDMRTAVLDDLEVVVSQHGDDGIDDSGNGSPYLDISSIGYNSQNEAGVVTTPLGSLVSGASRRVVFRLDVSPTQSRSDATLTVSVAWRGVDDEGQTSTSQQVTLTVDPSGSVSRDRDVASTAADAWLEATVRRAMVMNREENFREMRIWAKEQLSSFQAYCQRLPGNHERTRKMERVLRRVLRPMREHNRKEMSLSSMKILKGTRDYRVASPVQNYDTYIDEE